MPRGTKNGQGPKTKHASGASGPPEPRKRPPPIQHDLANERAKDALRQWGWIAVAYANRPAPDNDSTNAWKRRLLSVVRAIEALDGAVLEWHDHKAQLALVDTFEWILRREQDGSAELLGPPPHIGHGFVVGDGPVEVELHSAFERYRCFSARAFADRGRGIDSADRETVQTFLAHAREHKAKGLRVVAAVLAEKLIGVEGAEESDETATGSGMLHRARRARRGARLGARLSEPYDRGLFLAGGPQADFLREIAVLFGASPETAALLRPAFPLADDLPDGLRASEPGPPTGS